MGCCQSYELCNQCRGVFPAKELSPEGFCDVCQDPQPELSSGFTLNNKIYRPMAYAKGQDWRIRLMEVPKEEDNEVFL
jgi:hypothetical protein